MALGAGVSVVVLLAVSQAVLPGLAEQQVRDHMKPYGTLENVSVSAFPAIELLWGKASSASATARSLSMNQTEAMKLAWEARGVHDSTVMVRELKLQLPGLSSGMVLHNAVILKRGDVLTAQATVTQADLDAASPSGVRIRLLESEPGTVKVSASGSLFGVSATVEAVAVPSEGKLVAEPLNIPFGSFVRLTIFSDPHVYLNDVSATPEGEGAQRSWRLALGARLR